MSRKEKSLARLKEKPKDFSWDELTALLEGLGYDLKAGDGSRRKFIHREMKAVLSIHQPHPTPVLKNYQVRDVLTHLKDNGLL